MNSCTNESDILAFAALVRSLSGRGAFCHASLSLSCSSATHRGLSSSASIIEGEAILRVPLACCLTASQGHSEINDDQVAGATVEWICRLAGSVAEEVLKKEASMHCCYLQTLPMSVAQHLCSWPREMLGSLGNPELEHIALGWKQLRQLCTLFVRQTYGFHAGDQGEPKGDAVKAFQHQLEREFPRQRRSCSSYFSSEHIVDLVISRAVKLDHPNGQVVRALVPVFDLFNHGVPNVFYSLVDNAVEVRALRTISPHEELLCDYGLTVEKSLLHHGFIPPEGAPFEIHLQDGGTVLLRPTGTDDITSSFLDQLHSACENSLAMLEKDGEHVNSLLGCLSQEYRTRRRAILLNVLAQNVCHARRPKQVT